MSSATATRPRRGFAVPAVGVVTLLLGIGYLILGGVFISSGAKAARDMSEPDAAKGWEWLLQVVAGFVIVIGIAFVVPGVLAVVAGLGDVMRRSWARLLTYGVAILAILWGLAFAALSSGEPFLLILAAAQILYGVAAFAVLIWSGRESSRARGGELRGGSQRN